jgi:hypothetical protein
MIKDEEDMSDRAIKSSRETSTWGEFALNGVLIVKRSLRWNKRHGNNLMRKEYIAWAATYNVDVSGDRSTTSLHSFNFYLITQRFLPGGA